MKTYTTSDNLICKEGDIVYEVGQYANKQWFIRPHKVIRSIPFHSNFNYFKVFKNGRKYLDIKKAPTN